MLRAAIIPALPLAAMAIERRANALKPSLRPMFTDVPQIPNGLRVVPKSIMLKPLHPLTGEIAAVGAAVKPPLRSAVSNSAGAAEAVALAAFAFAVCEIYPLRLDHDLYQALRRCLQMPHIPFLVCGLK